MTDQTTKETTEKRITFDELVAYGIAAGANVVRGMPWSFTYEGLPVTHEHDDLYLIGAAGDLRFSRDRILVTTSNGRVWLEDRPSQPTPTGEGSGRTHELKVWPQYADALESGAKTFEFRRDDREPRFAVGDVLRLREFVPEPCREFDAETNTCPWGDLCEAEDGHYTGREWSRRVTYVARGGVIPEGYCCMAIEQVPTPPASRGTEGNGCLCGKCGLRYRVDVQVPHALWPKIAGATELLCPRCIADGLEAQGEFAAFRLVEVDPPTAARGVTGLPTWEQIEATYLAALHAGIDNAPDFLERERTLKSLLRTLLSAAEQGERDRERLDWLERMGFIRDGDTWRFGIIYLNGVLTENVSVRGPVSLRKAVDVARVPLTQQWDTNGEPATKPVGSARPPHQGRA